MPMKLLIRAFKLGTVLWGWWSWLLLKISGMTAKGLARGHGIFWFLFIDKCFFKEIMFFDEFLSKKNLFNTARKLHFCHYDQETLIKPRKPVNINCQCLRLLILLKEPWSHVALSAVVQKRNILKSITQEISAVKLIFSSIQRTFTASWSPGSESWRLASTLRWRPARR